MGRYNFSFEAEYKQLLDSFWCKFFDHGGTKEEGLGPRSRTSKLKCTRGNIANY